MKKVLAVMGIALCLLLALAGILFSIASLPLILYWCGVEQWYMPFVIFPSIPCYGIICLAIIFLILMPLFYVVYKFAEKCGIDVGEFLP